MQKVDVLVDRNVRLWRHSERREEAVAKTNTSLSPESPGRDKKPPTKWAGQKP